jgi:hypothetical protein
MRSIHIRREQAICNLNLITNINGYDEALQRCVMYIKNTQNAHVLRVHSAFFAAVRLALHSNIFDIA